MLSSRASAFISPQQNQKENRTPGNDMWKPPRDEARDVLNDLVIGRHVGTEKLLKYPRHDLAAFLRNKVNFNVTFSEVS